MHITRATSLLALLAAAAVVGWPSEAAAQRKSTRSPNVTVIADFAVPQLGGTRRVWVYLPPDYATSSKRYPVLYMHDGQNVFDDSTSFAGEWGVDETLDSLHARGDRGVIVVAVDNGGNMRMQEYSPWATRFGEGKGDPYVDFLVKTLKPWADAKYRTLPDREHTAIAGSSMGGLISFYAALKYPEVFSKAGIFSPSFWIAPAAYEMATRTKLAGDVRYYMISGSLEGDNPQVYRGYHERMADTLTKAGLKPGRNLVSTIVPLGKHNEAFWRREFPAAYQWLFNNPQK